MCERQITGECSIRQQSEMPNLKQSEMPNLKECMKEKLNTFFFQRT